MYEEGREKDSKPVNNPYDNINMPLTTQRFRVCFGIRFTHELGAYLEEAIHLKQTKKFIFNNSSDKDNIFTLLSPFKP